MLVLWDVLDGAEMKAEDLWGRMLLNENPQGSEKEEDHLFVFFESHTS